MSAGATRLSGRIQLRRNLTSDDDQAVYQCRSETKDVPVHLSDQITLQVHCESVAANASGILK